MSSSTSFSMPRKKDNEVKKETNPNNKRELSLQMVLPVTRRSVTLLAILNP